MAGPFELYLGGIIRLWCDIQNSSYRFFLLTPMHKPVECYGEAGGKTFLDSTPARLPSRLSVDGTSIVAGNP